MFLKIDPQCFGPFSKFQDTKEIIIYASCVSRLSFRFLWLWFNLIGWLPLIFILQLTKHIGTLQRSANEETKCQVTYKKYLQL